MDPFMVIKNISAISYRFEIVGSGFLMERMDRMDPFMVKKNVSAISYGFEIVCSNLLKERMDRMDPFMVTKNTSAISYGSILSIIQYLQTRIFLLCQGLPSEVGDRGNVVVDLPNSNNLPYVPRLSVQRSLQVQYLNLFFYTKFIIVLFVSHKVKIYSTE